MTERPAAMKERTIEVTYAVSDIVALNVLIWRFWLSLILILSAVVILFPMIFGLLDGQTLSDIISANDWPFTGEMIGILLLWLLAITALIYWWRRRQGLHGPIVFTLTDEGVSFRNRLMSGLVFWSTIKSIKLRGHRVFLFVTRRSALILPRRAFDSDVDFDGFTAEVQQRWAQRNRR